MRLASIRKTSWDFTRVRIRVYSLDLTKWEEVEVLVDSGALFTSMPRHILEGLGLNLSLGRGRESMVEGLLNVILAGRLWNMGERRAIVPIIFGEPEDIPVLGATALESLGYQIDPISKKLKPIELLMI